MELKLWSIFLTLSVVAFTGVFTAPKKVTFAHHQKFANRHANRAERTPEVKMGRERGL